MTGKIFKRFYNTEQAAEYCNLTVRRLQNLRYDGKGPKCHRPGGEGHPQYDRDDLDRWKKGGTPDAKE